MNDPEGKALFAKEKNQEAAMSKDDVKKRVLETIERGREEIIGFLQQMIRIPSPVGEEREIELFVANKLRSMGLNVDMWEPDVEVLKKHPDFISYPLLEEKGFKDRPVVVGTLKGTGGGRSLMLQGHMDVMPAWNREQWVHDPWSGVIEGDRLYGRGAYDMKGGATAMIMALDAVLKAGVKPKGDVIIESVLDEEQGGASTVACCLRGYKADAAIITEPTDCMIIAASQGFYYLNVKVKGKSAHAARRWEGVSAIEKAFKVYQAIENLQNDREKKVSHPAYERSRYPYFVPLVVGAIQSGVEHGGVPAEAVLKVRMGFLANEDPQVVLREFEEALRRVADADPWMKEHPPEIEQAMFVKAGGIDIRHPIIQTLKNAYKAVTQTEPIVTGKTAGNEQRLLVHVANTPTILFGIAGGEAHSPNEYLGPIESLIVATKSLALTILDWCGVTE